MLKKPCDLLGEMPDHVLRLTAVGNTRRIAEINEVVAREPAPERFQNGQAAHARIEHADRATQMRTWMEREQITSSV